MCLVRLCLIIDGVCLRVCVCVRVCAAWLRNTRRGVSASLFVYGWPRTSVPVSVSWCGGMGVLVDVGTAVVDTDTDTGKLLCVCARARVCVCVWCIVLNSSAFCHCAERVSAHCVSIYFLFYFWKYCV